MARHLDSPVDLILLSYKMLNNYIKNVIVSTYL